MKSNQEQKTAEEKNLKQLHSDFLTLEEKYVKWFHEQDSFIEDYFVDRDLRNGFIPDNPLPEEIVKEALLIKLKFSGIL